jgi:transposase-like protein
MDQRLRFVGMALAGELSMTELCEAFSISRKTGYKWRERYAARGSVAFGPHHPLSRYAGGESWGGGASCSPHAIRQKQ